MTASDAPCSQYEGWLKQVAVSDLNELTLFALDFACPLFRALDDRHSHIPHDTRAVAPIMMYGLGSKVGYVGRGRERRFAGDSSLGRERYWTIANGPHGDDEGTLLSELLAYYSHRNRTLVSAFDCTHNDSAFPDTRGSERPTETSPTVILKFGPQSPNPFTNALGLENVSSMGIKIPLRILHVSIPRCIDLRLPEAQDWFLTYFVDMELSSQANASKATGLYVLLNDRPNTFGGLLPILLQSEHGGGHPFIQGVGAWLRSHGVDALIYPSARCNSSVSVVDGRVHSYSGWNLVDYRGANATSWQQHFGRTLTWRNKLIEHSVEINYTASGPEKGSWSTQGIAEREAQRLVREQELVSSGGKYTLTDLLFYSPVELDEGGNQSFEDLMSELTRELRRGGSTPYHSRLFRTSVIITMVLGFIAAGIVALFLLFR
jgi:hypothetical protein